MPIESHKQYLVIIHIEAPNAEKAMKRWREGEVVGLIHKLAEIRELTSAIGFDMGQKTWDENESNVPETMGFTPQKRSKRGLKRKKNGM